MFRPRCRHNWARRSQIFGCPCARCFTVWAPIAHSKQRRPALFAGEVTDVSPVAVHLWERKLGPLFASLVADMAHQRPMQRETAAAAPTGSALPAHARGGTLRRRRRSERYVCCWLRWTDSEILIGAWLEAPLVVIDRGPPIPAAVGAALHPSMNGLRLSGVLMGPDLCRCRGCLFVLLGHGCKL